MSTRQKNPAPPAPQLNGHDAGAGTDPQIEVVDDGGAGGDAPVVDVVDGAQAADPGIETLRQQLADEQRKREDAEREAATLRSQTHQQQREVVDNRRLVLDATIQRQEGEKKIILDRIKAAKEAGDYDAEVAAMDDLSQLNIDLKATKRGKAALEVEIDEGGTQQQRGGNNDPVEQMIEQGRLDPRSANWLRQHREFAQAGPNNDKLQRAHAYAMSHDGVVPASDEYFRLLEERLGIREPAGDGGADDGGGRQAAQQQRTTPPPAAPVSRAASMGGGGREIMQGITDMGNGKYRVTPQMRAFIESINMTVQEYVQNAVTLKNEGQIH